MRELPPIKGYIPRPSSPITVNPEQKEEDEFYANTRRIERLIYAEYLESQLEEIVAPDRQSLPPITPTPLVAQVQTPPDDGAQAPPLSDGTETTVTALPFSSYPRPPVGPRQPTTARNTRARSNSLARRRINGGVDPLAPPPRPGLISMNVPPVRMASRQGGNHRVPRPPPSKQGGIHGVPHPPSSIGGGIHGVPRPPPSIQGEIHGVPRPPSSIGGGIHGVPRPPPSNQGEIHGVPRPPSSIGGGIRRVPCPPPSIQGENHRVPRPPPSIQGGNNGVPRPPPFMQGGNQRVPRQKLSVQGGNRMIPLPPSSNQGGNQRVPHQPSSRQGGNYMEPLPPSSNQGGNHGDNSHKFMKKSTTNSETKKPSEEETAQRTGEVKPHPPARPHTVRVVHKRAQLTNGWDVVLQTTREEVLQVIDPQQAADLKVNDPDQDEDNKVTDSQIDQTTIEETSNQEVLDTVAEDVAEVERPQSVGVTFQAPSCTPSSDAEEIPEEIAYGFSRSRFS